MRKAGWFRELDYDDASSGSVLDAPRNVAPPDRERIVEYLTGAHVIVVVPRVLRDALDESRRITDCGIATDGTWIWPLELAYYVANHGVAVPPAFVEHMAANGWLPAAVTDDEGERILEALDS